MSDLDWEILTQSEGAKVKAPTTLGKIMPHRVWTATAIYAPRLTPHAAVSGPSSEERPHADECPRCWHKM
eukprot:7602029-Pyramimonas_sp.AAC.1